MFSAANHWTLVNALVRGAGATGRPGEGVDYEQHVQPVADATSAMSPREITCEKPTSFPAAQSIREAAMAPDCESSAALAGLAAICAQPALSLAVGTISPTALD